MLGWTQSNLKQTALRWLMMVYYCLVVFPLCGACHWITLVVIALCLTEVPRYLFYSGLCKDLVGYLRYNLFIVIMPFN